MYVSLCHGIGHALVDGTHLAHHDNDIAGDVGTVNDHFAAVEQLDHDANDPAAEKDHLDQDQDYPNLNYEFEHDQLTVDGTLR